MEFKLTLGMVFLIFGILSVGNVSSLLFPGLSSFSDLFPNDNDDSLTLDNDILPPPYEESSAPSSNPPTTTSSDKNDATKTTPFGNSGNDTSSASTKLNGLEDLFKLFGKDEPMLSVPGSSFVDSNNNPIRPHVFFRMMIIRVTKNKNSDDEKAKADASTQTLTPPPDSSDETSTTPATTKDKTESTALSIPVRPASAEAPENTTSPSSKTNDVNTTEPTSTTADDVDEKEGSDQPEAGESEGSGDIK